MVTPGNAQGQPISPLQLRRELYEAARRNRVELLAPLPWRMRWRLSVKCWRDRRCCELCNRGHWQLARFIWRWTGW